MKNEHAMCGACDRVKGNQAMGMCGQFDVTGVFCRPLTWKDVEQSKSYKEFKNDRPNPRDAE